MAEALPLSGPRPRAAAMPSIPRPPPPQESPIENHDLAPVIITGGAALAAIIALSRNPPAKPPIPQYNIPVPPRFNSRNITSHFIAAIPELTAELNLELATATQTETFTRHDTKKLWGLFDLGTSTVQIRVPVTYRYHLRLREAWRLGVAGQKVTVEAPAIRPSLPPAIHTDKLEQLAVRGWGRGGTGGLMEALHRDLTPMLVRNAGDEKYLALVRRQCWCSVAGFVKLRLEREGQWGGHFTEIEVRFPGETDAQPQLTINQKKKG
jgi:hypothetical protein